MRFAPLSLSNVQYRPGVRPVTGASIALMISEKLSLLPALFEVTSAFGTVGLSLNVTLDLSALGKILISMVMFLGRVGTLTLIVALAERTKRRRYTYPQEDIPIG
jgi:trk system potassium uptake protein